MAATEDEAPAAPGPGEWDRLLRDHGVTADEHRRLAAEIRSPELPALVADYEAAAAELAERVGPHPASPPPLTATRLGDLFDGPGARTRLLARWALLRRVTGPRDAVAHRTVLAHLARRRIDWSARDLSFMLRCAVTHRPRPGFPGIEEYHRKLVMICERADPAALRGCVAEIRALRRHISRHAPHASQDLVRLDRLLLRLDDSPPDAREHFGGDDFGRLLAAEVPDTLDTPGLSELLTLCATMTAARPGKTWRRQVSALLEASPRLPDAIRTVLAHIPRLGDDAVYSDPHGPRFGSHNTVLLLRALLWCVAELAPEDSPWAAPLLGDIACHTGTGRGGSAVPRAERVANVAVRVLAARGDEAAVTALARVAARVRRKAIVSAADRGIDAAARSLGLTRDELMGRAVPDHGLGPDGRREEPLGAHTAVLDVGDGGAPTLTFRAPTGKRLRSTPGAVRTAHGARLGELRAELGELRTLLSVQRRRLETALGEGRIWEADPWRRTMAHPVTGSQARRLIWEVSTDSGRTWRAGLPERDGTRWRLRDTDGAPVWCGGDAPTAALLRLWHPIRATAETVRAWRDHLVATELRQPVKQAFREVYLPTPVEEAARAHSERYAGHILEYARARALLRGRGWRVPQLGPWDGGTDVRARRTYRDAASGREWTAVFSLSMTEVDDGHDSPVSYCSSGRVRFVGADDGAAEEPAPKRRWWPLRRFGGRASGGGLDRLPPLVFSEAMRDLDLAVGVTSIAADPEWPNRGTGRHTAYWRQTAFGALTESAETRRAALERLVPRLAIADRLRLTGRFLLVRGDLRTYKIHLGSANVLMEPDDSYLCVVPRPAGARQVYLPFEDDGQRLSVILSKAFLLAADAEITDPAITAQLTGGRRGGGRTGRG